VVERTYLTTSFKEKDEVKALGARWDAAASKWYVPEGKSLTPFWAWLPQAPKVAQSPPSTELDVQAKGVSLSRLLAGVSAAISRAFADSVWVSAEVVRASANRGHYYLELSERSDNGDVLAQARAVIWSRHAQALLTQFKQATGADLDAGIKVLLRARPVFKSQFGFSLEVDGIDPSYTLGNLEAKKREIRERLRAEGLYGRNRALAAPWDYESVLVVAPERGAGLGDFAKEAERLQRHGVCSFAYVHSRFQGEGAAAEIRVAVSAALATWSSPKLPDAIVIIRGGGAVNDLAWLNDYELAKFVCECPVPVLAGIGHERDSTSIDEVAHRSFDTPSKVIAGIEEAIRTRSQEARAHHVTVLAMVRSGADQAREEIRQLRRDVEGDARASLSTSRTEAERWMNSIRLDAVRSVHQGRTSSDAVYQAVRGDARRTVALIARDVPALFNGLRLKAIDSLNRARRQVDGQLPLLLNRATAVVRSRSQGVESQLETVFERGRRSVRDASSKSEALMREIAGQGPQKTLRRGFAVVRTPAGHTVTASREVADGAVIEVSVRDGVIEAVVRGTRDPNAADET